MCEWAPRGRAAPIGSAEASSVPRAIRELTANPLQMSAVRHRPLGCCHGSQNSELKTRHVLQSENMGRGGGANNNKTKQQKIVHFFSPNSHPIQNSFVYHEEGTGGIKGGKGEMIFPTVTVHRCYNISVHSYCSNRS